MFFFDNESSRLSALRMIHELDCDNDRANEED